MPAKRKVSDEQIVEAYMATPSVWGVGKALGICGQTVHERLVKLGLNRKMNKWTSTDDEVLKREYPMAALAGKLETLAAKLNRTKPFICRQAKRLGLTDQNRPRPYAAKWKDMTEEQANGLLEAFKASPLGLGRWCAANGIAEVGFWKTMTTFFPDEWEAIIESKTPKTTKYRLGRAFEYRVRDILKRVGYFVMRSPGSRSPIDLLAVKHGSVIFVQCKLGGNFPVKEWNEFYDLALSVGAVPVLAWRHGYRGVQAARLVGRKDGTKMRQPMVPYSLTEGCDL